MGDCLSVEVSGRERQRRAERLARPQLTRSIDVCWTGPLGYGFSYTSGCVIVGSNSSSSSAASSSHARCKSDAIAIAPAQFRLWSELKFGVTFLPFRLIPAETLVSR